MNTFYHGDCLFVMNHDIEPESIDLIYLDPPFFTGKQQKGIAKWNPSEMPLTYEDGKRFWKDKGIADYAPTWMKHLASNPINRPDFAAYLSYMMERLEACKRVLKPTGSIYLHCDWRASHYLKMIMDEIFGVANFRNEIVWCYTGPSRSSKDFPKKHDTILRYSKSENYVAYLENVRIPYKELHTDKGDSSIWGKNGGLQNKETRMKYLAKGKVPEDFWLDFPSGGHISPKERVGYPTQKPVALLERIILASSDEGDIVLDPFCGCGTAIIAAQKLNRQWIGIDINEKAHEVSGNRIGELPLDFKHYEYVSRDLEEVLAIEKPIEFERWVNGYFKATKPHPDKGVDGITSDNIPIQTKTFKVNDSWVKKLVMDAKFHPSLKQGFNRAILVSQKGFEDNAYQMQFEIDNKESIKVDLLTPSKMLPT